MKIAWIKDEKDRKSFQAVESFGLPVIYLKNEEDIDNTIDNLIEKNCKTIIISNEVASFSQNIFEKYPKEKVSIIISPKKE